MHSEGMLFKNGKENKQHQNYRTSFKFLFSLQKFLFSSAYRIPVFTSVLPCFPALSHPPSTACAPASKKDMFK